MRQSDISPRGIANAIFSELCISEGEIKQHYKDGLSFYETHIEAVGSSQGEAKEKVL